MIWLSLDGDPWVCDNRDCRERRIIADIVDSEKRALAWRQKVDAARREAGLL